ncbi:hypothetical protein ACHQM5_020873 [Ranunculus cassubicifolius]
MEEGDDDFWGVVLGFVLPALYAVSASVAQEEAETIVFPRDGPGVSYGLNWALAEKGVIVKDKAFYNLKSSELQKKGGITAESLSGLPAHVRGDVIGGTSKISKGDFNKLLKQVCINSDPTIGETVGLGSQESFLVADVERSSVILCGKAFSDTENVKSALSAVAGPVISARGGLPLPAKLLMCGDSVVLVFASDAILKSISNRLVSTGDVILSSHGVSPLFQTGNSTTPSLFKLPSGIVIASSDRSGTILSASKLSPGQAAYHLLAGYQNGKFVPAYSNGPSAIQPLDVAKSLLSKVKDHEIPSFLVNVNDKVTGSEFVKLVESAVSKAVPAFEPRALKLEEYHKGNHQLVVTPKLNLTASFMPSIITDQHLAAKSVF